MPSDADHHATPGAADLADTLTAPTKSPGDRSLRTLPTVDPGQYLRGAEIARGGMGRIVAARDLRLGRDVAIKEIFGATPDLELRFEREIRITARLQHPSIVDVHEAGYWPSGEPFFVMKLVQGRSLEAAIARTPPAARLSLLPHLVAATDALAYAHAHRVIHRDLKPGNVLVGDFGETVVIDWGLAKHLDDPSDELTTALGHDADVPALTQAGAVMGTPAYMAPEQARGEPVDERADVYALGAMLYHLLAGSPPYTGNTAREVVDSVLAGPPARLEAEGAAIPSDLGTIVAKAMAREPSERYPSAKELADELRTFQTGKLVASHQYSLGQLARRWLRRNRAPVAVGAAAALVLTGFGVVSIAEISRSRGIAETRRAEAEDLLDFMLFDLREKLEPLGRLDLLGSVAGKAARYYERQSDLRPEDLLRRSEALTNLGDVLDARGDLAEALRQQQASLELLERVLAADPRRPDALRGVPWRHLAIGGIRGQQGDMAGQRASFERARALAAQLVARAPADPEAQIVLLETTTLLAEYHKQHEGLADALALHLEVTGQLERLVASSTSPSDWQFRLMRNQADVASVRELQGDLSGALAAYRAAMKLGEALLATEPGNATWQRVVGELHLRLGKVLHGRGEGALALAEFRAGVTSGAALLARDPSNALVSRDLSVRLNALGDALLDEGQVGEALSNYQQALGLRRALAARDLSDLEAQRDLGTSLSNVGAALLAQGDAKGAQEHFEQDLAIARKCAQAEPNSTSSLDDLAVSHSRLGGALLALEDVAGAVKHFQECRELLARLVAEDPTSARQLGNLAESHEQLGKAYLALGERLLARREFESALARQRQLVARDETNEVARQTLESLQRQLEACRD
ncbi:MAG: protein kinase [Archangium sp.]|nr:protein kinase [Archangium sp.]